MLRRIQKYPLTITTTPKEKGLFPMSAGYEVMIARCGPKLPKVGEGSGPSGMYFG